MLITINSVAVQDNGKYKSAVVTYNREGKEQTKTIPAFAAKDVFNSLIALKSFPVDANVTLKKEGQYWNWVGIEITSGEQAAPAAKPAGKVIGSNYETPEERARKQVYITRSWSVTCAMEFLKHNSPKNAITVDDVLGVAKQFEGHVFAQPEVEVE